ncbi:MULTISPECIES: LysR family transcriptional regulator [Pseudomonas]|jgi:DNA-binding transcriptional LysR family regulator|uniref:HTH-type transcriptional regulator TrpI n=1 Tax=Pseudomonas soli TaxID=1306993 RepID=A0A2V4IAE5_9PSED|nr:MULTISPECIES: LysR family transcriptional regulator [Pseudomonas]PMZ98416.1 LysR family transcriptional regulator [Pseudomonas sp. FW305-42]PNA28310.1 LysR family transcriptional regulator [Pseudomonas sp. MPR-R1B]PNB28776.1 LysR family transcriptional regulator [Pseudomonas sp. DP16D-E2]PNB45477.1 LysR family transcriptional regulator [Pseudomonas sp. FW305-17]PNB64503.1 LysR family transcriptional regulator [Pseudomonas sp. GW531-E2]
MSKRLVPSMTALQCFEAAARHLSFTRAAEELHLTQSAVSKQVAQLEEMLRHHLFLRIRRRLQLTPAGSLYLAEVNKILTQVDMSSRYVLSYGSQTEVLKVATQPSFGVRWLIPHLKGFGKRHPNLHLDIRNEMEPFALLQGSADVVFFYGQGTWPGATCIELFGEEVVPVCAPELLQGRTLPDAGAVAELVLLQSTSRPQAWHEWFLEQGLHTDNSYHGPRFDTFYMALSAAQAGCGVALVPSYLVAKELAEGSLVLAWDHAMKSNGAHYLAYAEHAAEVPKVRALVEWVAEQIQRRHH